MQGNIYLEIVTDFANKIIRAIGKVQKGEKTK